MTTEHHVYKAQGFGDIPVESVVIKILLEVPEFKSLSDAADVYQHNAQKLCAVLRDVLPGGTFDRLLVEMLKEKASFFKVPYGEKE